MERLSIAYLAAHQACLAISVVLSGVENWVQSFFCGALLARTGTGGTGGTSLSRPGLFAPPRRPVFDAELNVEKVLGVEPDLARFL